MDIKHLLDLSSQHHSHLCPHQIIGASMGLCGLKTLNLAPNRKDNRFIVITETDGCFADGLSAATNCTVGHRTLRLEDYGKVAATFVDVQTRRAFRVAPVIDIRQLTYTYAPDEPRHYFAQMQAYQIMPDEEMFTVTEVQLSTSIEAIVSRPGTRVDCDVCGEEIMNEREVKQDGLVLCRACAETPYYQLPVSIPAFEKTIA